MSASGFNLLHRPTCRGGPNAASPSTLGKRGDAGMFVPERPRDCAR